MGWLVLEAYFGVRNGSRAMIGYVGIVESESFLAGATQNMEPHYGHDRSSPKRRADPRKLLISTVVFVCILCLPVWAVLHFSGVSTSSLSTSEGTPAAPQSGVESSSGRFALANINTSTAIVGGSIFSGSTFGKWKVVLTVFCVAVVIALLVFVVLAVAKNHSSSDPEPLATLKTGTQETTASGGSQLGQVSSDISSTTTVALSVAGGLALLGVMIGIASCANKGAFKSCTGKSIEMVHYSVDNGQYVSKKGISVGKLKDIIGENSHIKDYCYDEFDHLYVFLSSSSDAEGCLDRDQCQFNDTARKCPIRVLLKLEYEKFCEALKKYTVRDLMPDPDSHTRTTTVNFGGTLLTFYNLLFEPYESADAIHDLLLIYRVVIDYDLSPGTVVLVVNYERTKAVALEFIDVSFNAEKDIEPSRFAIIKTYFKRVLDKLEEVRRQIFKLKMTK
jgi:hypothetical protein